MSFYDYLRVLRLNGVPDDKIAALLGLGERALVVISPSGCRPSYEALQEMPEVFPILLVMYGKQKETH